MKGNERKRTFMLITIPVLILFFAPATKLSEEAC